MKGKTVLITLVLLAVLIMPAAVSAQNVTISNLDLVSKQAVLIYSSSGVLLGSYNTSSNVISLPTSDFVMVLKPNAISRFSNPVLFLSDSFATIETYWLQIFMIVAGIMLLLGLAAYGRRH